MASPRTTGLFTRWNPTQLLSPDRQRLRQNLEQVTNALEFGPVPAAYATMQWDVLELPAFGWPQAFNAGVRVLPRGAPGLTSGAGTFGGTTWSVWPIALGVWIDKGTVKFAMERGSTGNSMLNPSSGLFEQRVAHQHDDTVIIAAGPPADERKVVTLGNGPPIPEALELIGRMYDDAEFWLDQNVTTPIDDPEELRPLYAENYIRFMIYDIAASTDSPGGDPPSRIHAQLFLKYLAKIERVPPAEE